LQQKRKSSLEKSAEWGKKRKEANTRVRPKMPESPKKEGPNTVENREKKHLPPSPGQGTRERVRKEERVRGLTFQSGKERATLFKPLK